MTANSVQEPKTSTAGTRIWLSIAAIVVATAMMIRTDLQSLHRAAQLSAEGSPPLQQDANSSSGYIRGQRHFLGTHERGDTYRWIALTQEVMVSGIFSSSLYRADSGSDGRVQLMPRLYAVWLAAISWGVHFGTGDPIAIAVEKSALWEPAISHLLAFIAAVAFMTIRSGLISGAATGVFLVFFPPFSGQFISGVLTQRTWALLLATYAIATALPQRDKGASFFGARSAITASLAIWLDPAFGFPVVVMLAVAGLVALFTSKARQPFLSWSLIGSMITFVAWLIDQGPWTTSAGELRYVSPLYGVAWLGIGLGLDGGQKLREARRLTKWNVAQIIVAIALLSTLVYTQIHGSYKGWLYANAAMRRITSVDETNLFNTLLDWLSRASTVEILSISIPVLATAAAAILSVLRKRNRSEQSSPDLPIVISVFACILVIGFFEVRWTVIAALLFLPIQWKLAASYRPIYQRAMLAGFSLLVIGLSLQGNALSGVRGTSSSAASAGPSDVQTLIYRQFSHWFSSQTTGQDLCVLAPPEFSDSLVFHGNCRVLMSTAWESYPGQVAASRVLSAPESSEVEAVLQSRGITHIILTSWDNVLPALVRAPESADKNTLYARLQRWVLPPFLRPMPYLLPPVPGYADQKIAVFKVTSPQDEALSLSRLAEYFLEVNRDEPAGLVVKVLTQSYPDDPNAAIARALVYAHVKDQAGFGRELARLTAEVMADRAPLLWDRRIQRAIVLAAGRQHDLARKEVSACLSEASSANISDLTPLQAYRLHTLAKNYGLDFPDPILGKRVASLGSGYGTGSSAPR